MKRVAVADIGYYDPEDGSGDAGWFVTVQVQDSEFDIGRDAVSDPGYSTIDEALSALKKWASGRGLKVHNPLITMAVTSGEAP